MTKLDEQGPTGQSNAAARVAEISRLFESIRQVLDHMIQAIGTPDGQTPKAVVSKLNELQSVHLKVLAAEEAFHDNQDTSEDENIIDFDAVRAEIGRQLDRLRTAIETEKVSAKPQQCATCSASLSV